MLNVQSLRPIGRIALIVGVAGALSGCAQGQGFQGLGLGGDTVARAATAEEAAMAERDIEAPEVFQATEAGLWDGRPSLGGVWAAHPDVEEPERVIIRNQQNGEYVIGALFRRNTDTPGPRLQISSDAAAALGMLAGQPTNLDVVALRREAVPQGEAGFPAAPEVSAGGLDPVVSDAERAIEEAATRPQTTGSGAAGGASATGSVETASLAPTAAASAAPAPAASSRLDRAFIQIGIFSVEQNARNTATAMRQKGMVPTVKEQSSNGRTFWRVVVGPAQTSAERAILLETIRGSGFTDAFAVRG